MCDILNELANNQLNNINDQIADLKNKHKEFNDFAHETQKMFDKTHRDLEHYKNNLENTKRNLQAIAQFMNSVMGKLADKTASNVEILNDLQNLCKF